MPEARRYSITTMEKLTLSSNTESGVARCQYSDVVHQKFPFLVWLVICFAAEVWLIYLVYSLSAHRACREHYEIHSAFDVGSMGASGMAI